jgi:RNA-directed DNA polymerase
MSGIKRLERLKEITSKSELADMLDVNISFFTQTLYRYDIKTQYTKFSIKKKSGGERIINAPKDELKDIQSRLSNLLLDCNDGLNVLHNRKASLSHGFARERSIITNAAMHRNQKNVLNIDLENFFDSFNFGRVRGFFIKNRDFSLNKDIATVIAKIACLDNKLPQGSPCSPVISNLITHSLDIRLTNLAKKNSCTYSRYADDITFSTRKNEIPTFLAKKVDGNFCVSRKLKSEINRAGFEINENKTRVQFKDSRQDVTGLIVNKKINTKSEYWRTARAMCDSLFKTGKFKVKVSEDETLDGNINKLGGMLSFIDSIDKYNHNIPITHTKPIYQKITKWPDYSQRLNVREKTYSKFLFYRNFYANAQPIILCEGKTDYVYLKSAINRLCGDFPLLGSPNSETSEYKPNIDFFNYKKQTKFLLDLSGGADFLLRFSLRYKKEHSRYKAPKSKSPVILFLDNDSGPNSLINNLTKDKFPNCPTDVDTIRNANFIHVVENLYLVLTPLINNEPTDIECFFNQETLNRLINGKKFNKTKDADTTTEYSKHIFSTKIVQDKKNEISFELFRPLLQRITDVIEDYKSRP